MRRCRRPSSFDVAPLHYAGQILVSQGRHAEAEGFLERAVATDASPSLVKKSELKHDYALALWLSGRRHEALHNFYAALLINHDYTKALNNLACASFRLVLDGQAESELAKSGLGAINRAMNLEPEKLLYLRNAASLFAQAGNDPVAAQLRALVFAVHPESEPPSQEDCLWELPFE